MSKALAVGNPSLPRITDSTTSFPSQSMSIAKNAQLIHYKGNFDRM
jgi:hypothetical protein